MGLNDHSIGYIDDDGTIVKLSSDAPQIANDAFNGRNGDDGVREDCF